MLQPAEKAAVPRPAPLDQNRLAAIERALVARRPGLGRTALVKLLYLVDHEAHRYLSRPVTGVCWRFHYFGPFSHAAAACLDRLADEGELTAAEVIYSDAEGVTYALAPGVDAPLDSLTAGERAIVNAVAERFGGLGLRELKDYVYDTEPMKRAQRGAPIDLAIVNGAGLEAYGPGADFEAIARGAEDAKAGRYVPADKVRRALRDRLRA